MDYYFHSTPDDMAPLNLFGPLMASAGFFGFLMFFLMLIILIVLIIAVSGYIFKSLGLYTMAKKRGLPNEWMAWVPIAQDHLYGQLIGDQVSLGSLRLPWASLFLPLVTLLGTTLSTLSSTHFWGIFVLFGLLIYVYQCTANYWLFSTYAPKDRLLFLILTIIFPFTLPYFVFALRNREADLSGQPSTRPLPVDTESILSIALGFAGTLSFFIFTSANGYYTLLIGILFGILSYQKCKAQNRAVTLSIVGILCCIGGLLISVIFLGFNLNESVNTVLTLDPNNLDYFLQEF